MSPKKSKAEDCEKDKPLKTSRLLDNLKTITYAEYAVGGFLRLWLFYSEYRQSVADRVEVSTPLNSWKRGNFHFVLSAVHL